MSEDSTHKTYKRETASVMLLALLGFFLGGLESPESLEIAKYLSTPIFLFAAGAFGMDSYQKQGAGR